MKYFFLVVVVALALATASPARAAQCGDGVCEGQEDCSVCSTDCGVCPTPSTTPTPTPMPVATPVPVAVTVYIQQGAASTTPLPQPTPTPFTPPQRGTGGTPAPTTSISLANENPHPIVLGDQTTEVVFGTDSLTTGKKPLTLILPADPEAQIELNFSAFFDQDNLPGQVNLSQGINLEKGSLDGKVIVRIAENTSLAASTRCAGAWDGKITAAKIPADKPTLPGKAVGQMIEIGKSDCQLDFNQPVEITFTGKNGWLPAYRAHADSEVTPIDQVCQGNLAECYYYQGNDLVVRTNHFTQFLTFRNWIPPAWWPWAAGTAAFLVIIYILWVRTVLARAKTTVTPVENQSEAYVAEAAHELKTPLAAIKGYLSMILSGEFGPVKPSLKKPLYNVSSTTERLSELINNVLGLSRLKSGKMEFNPTTFAIDEVVKTTTNLLSPLAQETNLALSVNVPSVSVSADTEKVRQILTNLIGNALKYTTKGSVIVSGEVSQNLVKIYVTNTGPAISKAEQTKLFAKFSQGKAGQGRGSGLGLYLSRELARKMNGDVWLVSSDADQTTFAFSLPLAAGASQPQTRPKTKFGIIIFVVTVAPLFVSTLIGSINLYRHQTAEILARREALVYLTTTTLQSQFEKLIGIGTGLTTSYKARLPILIKQGRWQEAIQTMKDIPNDFPVIETVLLVDPEGNLKATTPMRDDIVGVNFSYRDWYQGVSQSWQPYVSEIFKSTSKPQLNVIVVAIPIKTDDGQVVGILGLSVLLDEFLDWSREVNVGPGGFVYFVDKQGQVAGHPEFPSQEEIVNFSGVAPITKLIRGESGVEQVFNPIENKQKLVTYQPAGYGWGAVVTQDAKTAFLLRKATIRRDLITLGLIFAVGTILALVTSNLSQRLIEHAEEIDRLILEKSSQLEKTLETKKNNG